MLELIESKSGLMTLKYNNKYIHSKYDPLKESKQLIESNIELLEKNKIVVYGLGLGYHINQLLEKITEDTIIYIFEWCTEIVDLCKKYNVSIFNKKNINIIDSSNEKFYNELVLNLGMVNDIIIHKPSLEIIKDQNTKLYNKLREYSINKISIEKDGSLLESNFKFNIKCKHENIKILIEHFKHKNKPIVIASAGPSLDAELTLLKKNREKFIIISAGSSLRSLKDNDITPDAIVIIDGKEVVKKQLQGYENENMPLCFLSTSSRWAVEYYKGPKYMFFNEDNKDGFIITTGKTVAVAAIDIAIKSNTKEIILLGQDLAFIGKKSHTCTFEKIYGFKDEVRKNSMNRKVKGINGKMLETTEGYLYFKEQIEALININKQVKFINCSKGAYINEAEHMEFKRYLDIK